MNKLPKVQTKCIKKEVLWDYFKGICQENSHKIERIFDISDLKSLAFILKFSSDAGIKEIPYYNKLLKHIESEFDIFGAYALSYILPTNQESFNSQNQVAMFFNKNPDVLQKNMEFFTCLYDTFFKFRFMFTKGQLEYIKSAFEDIPSISLRHRIKGYEDLQLKSFNSLLKECSHSEARATANTELDIDLPKSYNIDYDFQSKLVMIKNEATNRTIIIHSSQNFTEESVNFGKKLIDAFSPEVLFCELPPKLIEIEQRDIKNNTAEQSISLDDLDLFLESPSTSKRQGMHSDPRLASEGSNLQGGRILKTLEILQGEALQHHFENTILDSLSEINDEEETVNLKISEDQYPLDMETFVYYFAKKFQGEVVFSDLHEDEQAHNFISSTLDKKRHQIKHFIKWTTTLSTASWYLNVVNSGCHKCNVFFNKGNLPQNPIPITALTSQKFMSNELREKLMAFQICKFMQDPKYNKTSQEDKTHLLAFVRDLNYLKVAKYTSNFLSNPAAIEEFQQEFIEKYRCDNPSSSVWNDSNIFDSSYRQSMVKKWALYNSLIQSPENSTPYFKITELDKLNTEIYLLKAFKKQNLAEHLTDIRKAEVFLQEEDLEKDLISEMTAVKNPQNDYQFAQNEFLKEKYNKDGGVASCPSLSYLQSKVNTQVSKEQAFKEAGDCLAQLGDQRDEFDPVILDYESDPEY
ncbi:unnamed protein product [Moneuplotes crassus]|uniref:Uncharacterized protein n=1 Tax=Euplotes crassus TaxID=5936 RepID=A0AAD1U1S9_EUPCR|nr:unnamed protein product [Moneuplotes crassus]